MTSNLLKILGLISCGVFLCACETTLTQKEIHSEYNNLKLNEFIKKRYTRPTVNRISKALTGLTGKHAADPNIPYMEYSYKILSDGKSVIYPLHFNYLDERLLYKPANEIRLFCKEKGGVFRHQENFGEYVKGLYESPLSSYDKTMRSSLPTHLSVEIPDIIYGNSQTISINKRDLASQSYWQTVKKNKIKDVSSYKKAYRKNAFGRFMCRDFSSGKELWRVNIMPIIGFLGAYRSDKTSTLVILITPHPKRSHAEIHIQKR